MKFVTIKLACTVVHGDAGDGTEGYTREGELAIRMTAGDKEQTPDVLERLARILDDKLNLVDIGDCD